VRFSNRGHDLVGSGFGGLNWPAGSKTSERTDLLAVSFWSSADIENYFSGYNAVELSRLPREARRRSGRRATASPHKTRAKRPVGARSNYIVMSRIRLPLVKLAA